MRGLRTMALLFLGLLVTTWSLAAGADTVLWDEATGGDLDDLGTTDIGYFAVGVNIVRGTVTFPDDSTDVWFVTLPAGLAITSVEVLVKNTGGGFWNAHLWNEYDAGLVTHGVGATDGGEGTTVLSAGWAPLPFEGPLVFPLGWIALNGDFGSPDRADYDFRVIVTGPEVPSISPGGLALFAGLVIGTAAWVFRRQRFANT